MTPGNLRAHTTTEAGRYQFWNWHYPLDIQLEQYRRCIAVDIITVSWDEYYNRQLHSMEFMRTLALAYNE